MNKRTLNIIIGVGIAVVAIIMINKHFQAREAIIQRLIAEGRIGNVLVATTDIPTETTITSDMVTLKRVQTKSIQPGDLTSLESAIGKLTVTGILKDQHVNGNMIRSLGNIRYLSQAVPKGLRAITIPVNEISAVEGLLKAGDRVDIVGIFNLPKGRQTYTSIVNLFQGVKVLATGRNLSPYSISPKVDTVTLALKPEDVKLLTYALEHAKVRLVLRGGQDTSQEAEGAMFTMETLLKKLGAWAPEREEQKAAVVEIYKGTEQEVVPISR